MAQLTDSYFNEITPTTEVICRYKPIKTISWAITVVDNRSIHTWWGLQIDQLRTVGAPQLVYLLVRRYTIWLFNITMENGPFIDDFPIKTSIYVK